MGVVAKRRNVCSAVWPRQPNQTAAGGGSHCGKGAEYKLATSEVSSIDRALLLTRGLVVMRPCVMVAPRSSGGVRIPKWQKT